jgi:hypothetical protein
MKRELEAKLIHAANALGFACCPSIPRKRVEELRGIPSVFVAEEDVVPTTQTKAKHAGYYPVGPFRRTCKQVRYLRKGGPGNYYLTLSMDVDDANPKRVLYRLVELNSNNTGQHNFSGLGLKGYRYSEFIALLEGIAAGVYGTKIGT